MDVVLNWLWQGGVVALAAALLLRTIPQSRAHDRYMFLWAACLAVLAIPFMPYLAPASSPIQATDAAAPSSGALVAMPAGWWSSTTLVIGIWLLWCAYSIVRAAIAAAALRDARGRCEECPPQLHARLSQWTRVRNSGRPTRLVLSSRVRSAAVLGGGRPLIALAPALVDRLNDADLDRVVIHEWAHIQRRDDAAQLVQLLMRIVAGWHPALWWLERNINLEREVACDEMTVALTGSTKAYASCLTTLAALRVDAIRMAPTLAAVSSSGLRHRIVRILATRPARCARPWRTVTMLASLTLAIVAMTVGSIEAVQSVALTSESIDIAPMPRPVATQTRARQPSKPDATEPVASAPAPTPMLDRRTLPSDEPVRLPGTESDAAPMPGRAVSEASVTALPAVPTDPDPLPSRSVGAGSSAAPPSAEQNVETPWAAAADAGLAMGHTSQAAGLATAGFFSRLGKKIARPF